LKQPHVILSCHNTDDDQGGFGAERDVTRWLAAPFRKFTKNGLELGCVSVYKILFED
jgi:hypothetical protein